MIIYLLFLLVLVVFPIVALVSAIGSPEPAWAQAGHNKVFLVVLIFITSVIGATYYWFWVRPSLKVAAA